MVLKSRKESTNAKFVDFCTQCSYWGDFVSIGGRKWMEKNLLCELHQQIFPFREKGPF